MKKRILSLLTALTLLAALCSTLVSADNGYAIHSVTLNGASADVRLTARSSCVLYVGLYTDSGKMEAIRQANINGALGVQSNSVLFDSAIGANIYAKAFLMNTDLIPLCSACDSNHNDAALLEPIFSSEYLWTPDNGAEGFNYRIPGIIALKSGVLLAYCEKRSGTSDWANIDIVYKRSADGGQTWEAERTLISGIDIERTVNNPVMIEDSNGCVHCLYEVEYGVEELGGGIFHRTSQDGGLTWTSAEDISYCFPTELYNAAATGPGHGICKRDGTLLIPLWMVPKEADLPLQSHQFSVLTTLYSADCGKTWTAGDIIDAAEEVYSPNESVLIELQNGQVMINARNKGEAKYRAVAHSPTGYSDWTQLRYDQQLPDPICFGSMTRYDSDTLLFVNNNSQSARSNITLRVSADEGGTWDNGTVIRDTTGGYADIAVDNRQMIYILAEGQPYFQSGDNSYYMEIIRFNMSWLQARRQTD